MSAVGFVLIGFGVLTVWSGLEGVIVFDVLRTFIGSPSGVRTGEGALVPPGTLGLAGPTGPSSSGPGGAQPPAGPVGP